MPEVTFTLQWPDGTVEGCYSPSTIVREYFAAGTQYPVADLLTRSRTAFGLASDRVAARYGYACSSAAAQLAKIEARARRFAPADIVTCLTIT